MNWWTELWFGSSTAHQVLLLGLVCAGGVAIGKIKVLGIRLGIVGVLFVGILFGHLGMTINAEVLEFARSFGFVLFAYTLGLQIGPGFVGALRQSGLWFNALALVVVTSGAALATAWIVWRHVPVATGAGVFSGATTSTPSFAAAQQALKQLGAPDAMLIQQSLGYAVAYPCGIVGIIVVMALLRLIFKIDVKAEVAALETSRRASAGPVPVTRNFEVRNPSLSGVALGQLPNIGGVVVSRFSRGGTVEIARADTRLELGDILHVVGPLERLEQFRLVTGSETESKVDLKRLPGPVVNRRVVVTQGSVLGEPLAEVLVLKGFDLVVTRVTRGDLEFTPTPDLRLRFGDILMVVGESRAIDEVAAVLGNSAKALETPQLIPLFLGLALGMIVGAIPVMLPHLPAAVTLGIAGGPLLVGVFFGRLGNTGPLVWILPPSAGIVLRDFGIALFLAGVGLKSGEHFFAMMRSGDGLVWIMWGLLFTIVPLLTVGVVARLWKKTNYADICGLLAGSMTDSPALAFAQQMTGSDAPALAYATVYPLTMLLRVLAGQLIVFIFYKAAVG